MSTPSSSEIRRLQKLYLLNLLAHALGIPTPKDDIDGSVVWEVYWKKNLPASLPTARKMVTVAQVFLRLQQEAAVREGNIEIKS